LVGEYEDSGAEIKAYGWKPGSTWSTDPLFMKEGGQYYWYHNDHLGTPQMMTTSSGAVVWKAKYTSFGKAAVDPSSTVVNPLRFAGQYFDAETGLHYNYWRYYDPRIGRYLRADPIGLDEGINLYTYALSNPINAYDPNGLRVPFLGWILKKAKEKIIDAIGGEIADKIGDLIDLYEPELGVDEKENKDSDKDGMKDFMDPDDDNDGIPDENDHCDNNPCEPCYDPCGPCKN